MPKFACLLVIVALAVVQGLPAFQDDIADAAASGDWDKVHEILARSFGDFGMKPFLDIRTLKSPRGGHVFAETDVNFKSSSNHNGQVSQRSGGHRVVNEDGKVEEFDYKP